MRVIYVPVQASTVGVVGVKKFRFWCLTATMLIYLVTCNWLLNCTTGVFTSGHSIAFRNSRHRHSSCFWTVRFRAIFHLRMHRNSLAAGLWAIAGFNGWAPGKEKEVVKEGRKEGKNGGRMHTPNFWNVAVPLPLCEYCRESCDNVHL